MCFKLSGLNISSMISTLTAVENFNMTRKAFEGYDEPVNIDMDPEEALKIVLYVEPRDDDSKDSESFTEERVVLIGPETFLAEPTQGQTEVRAAMVRRDPRTRIELVVHHLARIVHVSQAEHVGQLVQHQVFCELRVCRPGAIFAFVEEHQGTGEDVLPGVHVGLVDAIHVGGAE